MKFKLLYEQYVTNNTNVNVNFISFLYFCKEHSVITVDDRNALTQAYKEGPKCISAKKKKKELENKVNNNFKVSSFYFYY